MNLEIPNHLDKFTSKTHHIVQKVRKKQVTSSNISRRYRDSALTLQNVRTMSQFFQKN